MNTNPALIPPILQFPSRTVFRRGCIASLGKEAASFGRRGLIIHGNSSRKNGTVEKIRAGMSRLHSVKYICYHGGEPSLDDVEQMRRELRSYKAEWLAAAGGGSILDLGKAAAGLARAPLSAREYQKGETVEERGIPFIAIPTTAGTGSEATVNAVITDRRARVKKSIRSPHFFARLVMLDAEAARSMPDEVLVNSGMDAFVQAYESYISRHATWLSETLALRALRLIDANLTRAYTSREINRVEKLLLGSYLCGIALSLSRLGVIHGIVHPLGALYGFPHGRACAAALLPSIALNKNAMGGKYKRLSELAGKDFKTRARELCAAFEIKGLLKRNMVRKDRDMIVSETLGSGSTRANPRKISEGDIDFLLSELIDK